MKRLAACLLAGLALAGAGSCSDSSGPVAGDLTVSLTTPNPGADAALLLTVSGPQALTSVTAPAGVRVFAQPLGTVTRFALTGTLTNGAVLTIGVTNVAQVAQYTATIQGVAAPDFQLRSLSGYSLTVAR
ncbi:MAG TPA: hypothetical protein VFI66_07545 [Gemmatimonadales bacterium]|nr:hypothetical protein [Gemmatimonadales bacterium]